MISVKEAREIIAQADNGEIPEIFRGDSVVSSKEIYKIEDDVYGVMHNIDGSDSYFTKNGLLQALIGKRDIWEGDLEQDYRKK